MNNILINHDFVNLFNYIKIFNVNVYKTRKILNEGKICFELRKKNVPYFVPTKHISVPDNYVITLVYMNILCNNSSL